MAEEDKNLESAAPKEPSLIIWLMILGVLSLFAGGAGGVLGLMMAPAPAPEMEKQAQEQEAEETKQEYSSGEQVKMLPPIVTNLISPRGTFVRLEGAAVFGSAPGKDSDVLISRISSDIVSVLHTMSMAQISGPSGLQHLREDLSARAAIRSQGLVKEIVLHSLVIE